MRGSASYCSAPAVAADSGTAAKIEAPAAMSAAKLLRTTERLRRLGTGAENSTLTTERESCLLVGTARCAVRSVTNERVTSPDAAARRPYQKTLHARAA